MDEKKKKNDWIEPCYNIDIHVQGSNFVTFPNQKGAKTILIELAP